MGDHEVFIPCDHCGVRSRDIWVKGELILTLCGHAADKHWAALQAHGFNPLESEALTK